MVHLAARAEEEQLGIGTPVQVAFTRLIIGQPLGLAAVRVKHIDFEILRRLHAMMWRRRSEGDAAAIRRDFQIAGEIICMGQQLHTGGFGGFFLLFGFIVLAGRRFGSGRHARGVGQRIC